MQAAETKIDSILHIGFAAQLSSCILLSHQVEASRVVKQRVSSGDSFLVEASKENLEIRPTLGKSLSGGPTETICTR